jgi:hypothetical protein
MTLSRREFNKALGAALAAFILARCKPIRTAPTAENTPTPPSAPTPQPTSAPAPTAAPSPSPTPTPRELIRDCWLKLDELAKIAPDLDEGQKFKTHLISEHLLALSSLERAGQIKPEISELVQEAYQITAQHVWRSRAPITCYEIVKIEGAPPDYTISSVDHLQQQALILTTLQNLDQVTPDTLEKAQAAIEHDMAYYALVEQGEKVLNAALMGNATVSGDFPGYEDLELPVTADVIEAARFLVELLGRK